MECAPAGTKKMIREEMSRAIRKRKRRSKEEEGIKEP